MAAACGDPISNFVSCAATVRLVKGTDTPLSLARLVEARGVKIWVDNTLGSGSTFSLHASSCIRRAVTA